MRLVPGQTLSFYEVLGPLGAGGMGEVVRARDTRLGREVALKVLPERFVEDAERLRRFEREARTLAALSHPHVGAIYSVEQVDDVCFLALELVPGEDLAERLARGPLPSDEAIDVCRQIADGLAAAHDAGIVHRDLKPANVRITPDGVVKLLDFGLAKPALGAHGESSGSATPDSVSATEEGLVLGTPTYMAPEQARGRPVDRRADVWAFGCVLFECLTGRRAFPGESLADVMASILEREPDLRSLPSGTPKGLERLLRRCLAKDPRRRLQHLGDARLELEELASGMDDGAATRADEARGESLRSLRWTALALLAGSALGVGAAVLFDRKSSDEGAAPHLVRASLEVANVDSDVFPRLAPDARAVVYAERAAADAGGQRRRLLWRPLDALDSVPLPGTTGVASFAFAPEGDALVAVVRDERHGSSLQVVRVELDASSPRTVPLGAYAPDPNPSGGVVWTEGDRLVTSGSRNRLLTLPLSGGTWRELPISGLEALGSYTPDIYRALPGGRHVLGSVYRYAPTGFEPWVVAIDVETGVGKELVSGGHAAYLAPGQLLFSRGDTLFVAPFDLDAVEVTGVPRPILAGLRTSDSWRSAWFDVARDGTLIHNPGGLQGTERRIAAAGPGGPQVEWPVGRRAYDGELEIARDGSFLTVGVAAPSGLIELWGTALATPLMRPLLARAATDFLPGPIDAERGVLYFTQLSNEDSEGVWRAPLDAPERAEAVWKSRGGNPMALALTPDGRSLLVKVDRPEGRRLLEVPVPPAGATTSDDELREGFPIGPETWSVDISPDGRWYAYSDDVDGRRSIVLRRRRADGSFGSVYPVARESAAATRGEAGYWWSEWSTDPRLSVPTLLLFSPDGDAIVAVEVRGEDEPSFSEPRPVAAARNDELLDYVGLPDGRALLLLRNESELVIDRIELVLGLARSWGG